ncbi:hybrid sensor histidine kinase/response regulator [Stenotrophomonas acidaminiphila]|uniref:ATP-binding response regulator n=1 Tax=Stenotrophomonas acidaminiphila TaxID=128780 RepID=UPI0013762A07|nr:hybrid sensor histidine kinase/response regulator [Stenotrophomonas acidaminiphila]NCT88951.1 hybrid sensor histidine kinase/response regulator [Stenotrophomonas acidaminiphila]
MSEPGQSAPAAADSPPGYADISPARRVGLLEVAFARVNYGFGAMVVVSLPFIAWYAHLGQDPLGLVLWSAWYFVGFWGVRGLYRRYQRACIQDAPETVLRRWSPLIHGVALVYGSSMAVPPLLTAAHATFEFQLLYLVTIAAIVASNSVHASPVLSVFRCFFLSGWGSVTLLVPYTFPDHWHYVMPLALVYILTILRHSAISLRFFVQNVVLQEEGVRLAENFRRAKEQAEQALYDKNLFLTTASHDLRQPVHAMGFLVASISRSNRDPALDGALADLRQSVQSATQMFDALLDLSRIESGRVQISTEAVDLAGMIANVATLFREEARDRGLALRVRLPPGPAVVMADGTLLRQALNNLLHNALRYTRRGGILLAVRRRAGGWRCEVWDTGIGIAMREGTDIFSPFFRNEHAWDIDSAGHGLGLAVVARCCAMMRARHGFRSREGRGSCFWIQPDAAQAAVPMVVPRSPDPPPPRMLPQWSGSCLVVDDDPLVRSAWQTLMRSWGLEATCVESGSQALRLLESGLRPDVVFCDQRLRSGENGFELLCELLGRLPDARGAMISGELDSAELADAQEQGYLVLRKPVETAELQAVLGYWLPAPAAGSPP